MRVDQPVVNGEGLVGKVIDGRRRSLEDHPDHRQHERRLGRGRPHRASPALLKTEPSASPTTSSSTSWPGPSKVRRGQRVVTVGIALRRGWSRCSRAGIPIGAVTQVDPGELGVDQRVHVGAFADVRKLDFVQVLTGPTPRARQLTAQAP